VSVVRELPKYRLIGADEVSVYALQIGHVIESPRGYLIGFCNQDYAPHEVSHEWVLRHKPEPGGWFVIEDRPGGQSSFSDADPFEAAFAPEIL
jgi:hypothetical protein